LKACLSRDDSLETIEKYGHSKEGYGHNIILLWDAFKKRQRASVPVEFDAKVGALHDFEEIRYPEKLIRNGAVIRINPFVGDSVRANGEEAERSYNLTLPPIDSLVGLLFMASKANPVVFLQEIRDEQGTGSTYYERIKATLFGRAPA